MHQIQIWALKRWLPFRDVLPLSEPRPLEWQEDESDAFRTIIYTDIVQNLLNGDPVGVQHTFLTVLLDSTSVRLGSFNAPQNGISLRIQGIPHHNLARMVPNAPLHRAERLVRVLASHAFQNLSFVAIWAGFVALRDAYMLRHKTGMATDLAASMLYYSIGCLAAIGVLLLEEAVLPKLRVGPDRLAACYHDTEYARIWMVRKAPLKRSLVQAAAKAWSCPESAISTYQLHIQTSYPAVRAITRVIRGEMAQRMEDAPLVVSMQLPLVQNLRSAAQADVRFRVRVHLEHEAVVRMSAIALSLASYAAAGRLNWRTGFALDRPQTEEMPAMPAERSERMRSPPRSREGSVRKGERALLALVEGNIERKEHCVPKAAAEEIV